MATRTTITQENFSLLLSWLDADAETAARVYERIRARLIHVFVGRGCYEAEYLADLTFDRVAVKIPELDRQIAGDRTVYFLAVAKNIYFEWDRIERKVREATRLDLNAGVGEDREAEYECLEACLAELATEVRKMIVEYYRGEKAGRVQRRKDLARRLGISVEVLRVRAVRVRGSLVKCVKKCTEEK